MTVLQLYVKDPARELDERREARGDALPEHIHYQDEGCDLSPSCLNCVLPLCRYDQPGGIRGLRTRGRDEEIIRLRQSERVPIATLARRFGVSRRTVFRILRRCDGASPAVRRLQPEEDVVQLRRPGFPAWPQGRTPTSPRVRNGESASRR